MFLTMVCSCRVLDLLNTTDPRSVRLDEAKTEQILSLTNNMLLFICSQTPIMKKLIKSCQLTRYSFCSYNYISIYLIYGFLSINMVNVCLQIRVKWGWIQRQLTRSWSYRPRVTVPLTQTLGSNFLTSPDALTPPLTSSACKASVLVVITGRLMWLGRPTGSWVSPIPPFPERAPLKNAGWVVGMSLGVWSSLMGSTQLGMQGCPISYLSPNASVELVFYAVSLLDWWHFLRQTIWLHCFLSAQQPSQTASTWPCVQVTTTVGIMQCLL